jgi:DNA-binding MarR family transcriptional regulator
MDNSDTKNVEDIEVHLRKIDYIIKKKGRTILSDFSITVPQFRALQILINDGEMTISELSQKMDLACSTITDLVDRMENSELVKRKKDKKDKRVVRIEVQNKGNDILDRVLQKRIEYLSIKLKNLTVTDKENLRDALENLYLEMKE